MPFFLHATCLFALKRIKQIATCALVTGIGLKDPFGCDVVAQLYHVATDAGVLLVA